jgi:very-short-patch-repair endonuclease
MKYDDAWEAVSGLGAVQHGAFTRAQAEGLGVTARDLRRPLGLGLLGEPFPGVLVFAGAPDTARQRLWAATHACGGGFVAARRSAAWLDRLDGFDSAFPLEVLGARGRRIRGTIALTQHWGDLDENDLLEIDSIPCTSLARTICDVAWFVGRDRTTRAIDDFERRGLSLRWLSETVERLDRPGQSGTALVKRLLGQGHGRAPDSWFERLVEACLCLRGFPPWVRQHEVFDGDGEFIARIDLACPALRLGVEAHSKKFHFGAGPGPGDQRRDDEMSAVGWDVTYVGWYSATHESEAVAEIIERIARRRADDLGVPLPWAA